MAILFDLDGTLVDTADDIIGAMNNLCLELNKSIADPKLLKDNMSFGLAKILQIALNINITEIDPNDLQKLKDRFRELYRQSNFVNSKLFPGIMDLINNLQRNQFKIAVVTNKNLELARLVLDKVDLLNKIDCLVASDMVADPKPAPDSVLLAIEKLQVNPKDCIFIGDSEQDIIAGNAAGVRTVAALFGYIGDPTAAARWPANHFIEQPTEIWPLLKSLYFTANNQ